jgi:acetyl-CoA carboxylase biotin carboxylase subunit
VGGIKTNAGLFRRILADEDFRSGKIDTGYLERLGSLPGSASTGAREDVAAIAAAVFAVLDSTSQNVSNGTTTDAGAGPSAWKRTARSEGLM